jgi:hypothetical protein
VGRSVPWDVLRVVRFKSWTFSDGMFIEWDVTRAGPFLCAPNIVKGKKKNRRRFRIRSKLLRIQIRGAQKLRIRTVTHPEYWLRLVKKKKPLCLSRPHPCVYWLNSHPFKKKVPNFLNSFFVAGMMGDDAVFGENYPGNMDLGAVGGGAGGGLLNESDDSL